MTVAYRPSVLFMQRMDATRILLFGGLLLIILGMAWGEIYAIFISHVASAEVRERLFTVVSAVGEQDIDSVGAQFNVIEDLLEKRGRMVNTHSHMIAFGFLALTLMILQPVLNLSEQRRRVLAVLIIGGAFLQTLFVFASPYVGLWGNLISDLGGVLVIAGVVGNLLGLFKPRPGQPPLSAYLAPLLQSRSSRLLLQGGGLLILLGMLFGFYYAWIFVTQHEVQQWELLDTVLANAMANESEIARTAVSGYRRIQSKIAILAAAHSHAIELGMLAILLGFVQNFVFLDERWKVRWTWVFLTGSFLLPIFVYNATVVGLVSAGFADLSGFLALLALCAMLVGILRYTGAIDTKQTGGRV